MNKLVLAGNGFDLAHGMKTSYKDFICTYFKGLIKGVIEKQSGYKNNAVKIDVRNRDLLVDYKWYSQISTNITDESVIQIFSNQEYFSIGSREFYNIFSYNIENSIIKKALNSLHEVNWVDIEEIYYDELLKLSGLHTSALSINKHLLFIIMELERYLSSIEIPPLNNDILKILCRAFNPEDFKDQQVQLKNCKNITLLNFNYTTTLKFYQDSLIKLLPGTEVDLINIHGELNNRDNPIVFGFGDEMDDHYKTLEKLKDNTFLDYMKSFGYFRTNSYRRLIRFLEAGSFQVEIMGHSCGLSDRVMLNMIFEHPNCKSIKVNYYKWGDSYEETNYKTLTQNISRHFNKKTLMRDLVVDYGLSNEIPQSI